MAELECFGKVRSFCTRTLYSLVVLSISSSVYAAATYEFDTTFENTKIDGFSPIAMNNSGQIVGTTSKSDEGGIGRYTGYLYSPGSGFTAIGSLGSGESLPLAINNNGVVTGRSGTSSGVFDNLNRGFVYSQAAGMRDIGKLGGSSYFVQPSDINDSGRIVGVSGADDGTLHGFVYIPALGMRDLGRAFEPTAINNTNAMVGRGGAGGAFLYVPGQGYTQLGDLGGGSVFTVATDINDEGVVAGTSAVDIPDPGCQRCIRTVHAFIYSAILGMVDITPNAAYAYVSAINNLGQVVGWISDSPFGPPEGFLYDPNEGLQMISDLLAEGQGGDGILNSIIPLDINDKGQIIGVRADDLSALLLDPVSGPTPVPEPATFLLVAAGLIAITGLKRRRAVRTLVVDSSYFG